MQRDSLLCLTVSKNKWGGPHFCPSFKKVESRFTILSEKDKIFVSFFNLLSHSVKNSEGWTLFLYQGVEDLWSDLQFCPTFPKSFWQESQVCLTVSKILGGLQFCYTMLEKRVAVITILSHEVNTFVSCIDVLFRSVKLSERESKTKLHNVERFPSWVKFLSHSAENFVARITSLSSCVKMFVSWTKVLYHSATTSATSITISSDGDEVSVRWTNFSCQL